MNRKGLYFIAISIFIATVSCKEKTDTTSLNTEGWGVMKFTATEHDFGEINSGDKVEHTFEFTNEGDADLLITAAKGSCGCTVPDYSKEPLKPGARGQIKVKFDSSGKTGKQHKTVTIVANTQKGNETLDIRATIIGQSGITPTKQLTK